MSDSIIHDDIPPSINLVNQPTSWIKETNLRIGIRSEDLGSGIQSILCDKHGDGHFEACNSEIIYNSLVEDQNYVLIVKAHDRATNSSSHNLHWRLDSTPPTISLSMGPSSPIADTNPRFSFIPLDIGSGIDRIECRLDSQTQFSTCQTTFNLNELSDGPHSIEVRSVDRVGWTSQPILHSWVQDATAPSIRFTKGPQPISKESKGSFEFSGINNAQGVVTYECQLDGASEQTCTSPYNFNGLSDGQHSFSVTGLDFVEQQISLHYLHLAYQYKKTQYHIGR